MKVIAKAKGYFGERLIEAGEVFNVPDDVKASWFAPVEGKAASSQTSQFQKKTGKGTGSK